MTYDALDRMVEQRRSSGYQQIVYAPYGTKLALMNQQAFVGAFVKLPGGARAVYNSTGLAYYRHSDHLGSSRLATTPSRSMYFDVAYAPYGEDYNNSGTTTDLAFTDENQDTVSGTIQAWTTNLYDFLMREYRTSQGRWTSPDPSGLGAVNPANPQTWNRYAYVAGNPLLFRDALGLQLFYCDTGDGGGFYGDDENADDVEACGQAGGSFENVDVNTAITVNGNTNDVQEVSWMGIDTVVPAQSAQSANNNTKQRLACASKFAQDHSIAAAFGAQESFVGNLLGGNTISGLVDLGQTIFGSKTPTAGDVATVVLSGGGQGLPGGGPGFKGVAGQASDAIVGGAVAGSYNAMAGVGGETIELGITATGTVATPIAQLSAQTLEDVVGGIGLAKLGFDASTFLYGYFVACHP